MSGPPFSHLEVTFSSSQMSVKQLSAWQLVPAKLARRGVCCKGTMEVTCLHLGSISLIGSKRLAQPYSRREDLMGMGSSRGGSLRQFVLPYLLAAAVASNTALGYRFYSVYGLGRADCYS